MFFSHSFRLSKLHKKHKVTYYNLYKRYAKLMTAKAAGFYIRELAKIENCDLPITDDFGFQAIYNFKQLILKI